MKNKALLSLAAAFAAMLTFSGCSDEINYDSPDDGQGRVLIRPMLNNDVSGTVATGVKKAPSRAGGVASDELAAKTLIWISNSKGLVRKFDGVGQVPAEGIWLNSDNYIAEAWTGDSVSASFDKKYFKAREPFTISKGQTIQIDLELKISNVVVEVEYDDEVKDLLVTPSVTAGHKRGTLTFEGFDMEKTPGYFMMPSYDKNIAYTFTAKSADGSDVKKEGVIENARPGYKYKLKVVYNNGGGQDPIGAGLFQIVVDESEIVVEDHILIESAPVISGIGFDLATPVVGEAGKLETRKLWIQSVCALTAVEISCPTGFDAIGIGGNDFEIFGMQPSVADALAAHGFSYIHQKHTGEATNPEFEEMKLVFDEAFMNLLPNGEHEITVRATDANGRTGVAVMKVILTDASVQTVEVPAASPAIWATRATITGTVLKDGIENHGFNYREAGTQQWSFVAAGAGQSGARRRAARRAPAVGSNYSAVLTDLKPGTTYEYQAVCTGFESSIARFTTEEALQLKNASLEEWTSAKCMNDRKNVLIPASSEADMFWDSGNHGSATMNKEVTQQATDKVHSGQYSAKLCSQFVGVGTLGKFAAGNLFVGKYLKTDGTDGILGWGRPFTSRPTALRVWVHYTPGTVEYDNTNVSDIVKGQPDKGIIYVAIVDGSTKEAEGTSWPVVVKTKGAELFHKTDSNVIGYGEKVFTEATAGSDLVMVEIPISYTRTDLKASNIIITCSASKGGDYFAGGDSVMYLDDFELVY